MNVSLHHDNISSSSSSEGLSATSSDSQDLVFHIASPKSIYTKRTRRPSHIFKATKKDFRPKDGKDTDANKRKRIECDECGKSLLALIAVTGADEIY